MPIQLLGRDLSPLMTLVFVALLAVLIGVGVITRRRRWLARLEREGAQNGPLMAETLRILWWMTTALFSVVVVLRAWHFIAQAVQ